MEQAYKILNKKKETNMSGGIWTTQNKVLPDAYINFKGVSKPQASVGSRGIITAPMALSWELA